jgi:DNA-binding MarR family transcriptional regulator
MSFLLKIMKIEDEIKGRFRNEYHKGMINLIYTANSLHYQFLQFIKAHGLTMQQYNILRVLRGFISEPCSIDFLRERMLDKNSDVSRIVDKLFQKQLITRTENIKDRRQKDVEITKLGLDLLAQMDECELEVDTLLANLNTEELRTLNSLLDKIRD